MADTNYAQFRDSAPESGGPNTGGSTGGFEEKSKAAYIEINGESEVLDRTLRYNAGVRWVDTKHNINGPVTIGGVRQWQSLDGKYRMLPSLRPWTCRQHSAAHVRSRTMTRPTRQRAPDTPLPTSAIQRNQGTRTSPVHSTNFDLGLVVPG